MFSANAKDEIAAAAFERDCCPATFLRVLARFSRQIVPPADAGFSAKRLIAITKHGSVARAAIRAGKAIGVGMHAQPVVSRGARRHGAVAVIADRPIRTIDHPGRRCCRRAWLRAAYLACGSVADPRRTYHLEFNASDDAAAHALVRELGVLGIAAATARRRARPVVYVKSAAAVVELLGQLGASRSVFAFDDVLAVRATKNSIRRRVNGEAANAARAASTAARQRDAALRLGSRRAQFDRLSPAIREAIKLRIAHPASTLAELARAARPSITKPAMAARLRAVERIAGRPRSTGAVDFSRPAKIHSRGGPAGRRPRLSKASA